MTEDRLISYRVAGQMFGVCAKTVERKIKAGEFPQPVRFGRRPMLSFLELAAVIEKMKRDRGEKARG